MNIKWTQNDKDFIKNNAHHLTDEEIAKRLGFKHSKAAVRKMRQRLGISKKSGRGICELSEDE